MAKTKQLKFTPDPDVLILINKAVKKYGEGVSLSKVINILFRSRNND